MFSILFKFKNAVIFYLVYNVLNVAAKDEPPILSEEERFLRLDEAVDLDDILLDIVDGLVGHHGISCVAFVCDSVYLNVFGGEFFKKLNLTSSVMIVPKESEDLLSPNYDTLEALRRVRKDGCGAYVILMANGIQSARLLKFGDRYRAIDTRAKFVILHDFRLFKGDLHYIWKRIVNVVFLRRHSSNAEAAWYDVTTVPFPSPIRGVLLPRRLDTWRRGRFRDDAVLFQDKTKDLNGQTLNVVYLQHVPAVVRDADAIGGLEMQILKTLAEAINFKTKVYEPPNVETQQWGQRQVNGTFSGLLGEMVAGKADIALGDLHYTPYHLELTDLTIPYISQCLTFLTPESLTDNAWKTLILPFQLDMWLGVMAVLFGTGFLFNILAKIQRYLQQSSGQFENNSENNAFEVDDRKGASIKKKERPVQTGLYLFDELANGIVYTFGMLMLVSLPKFPLGWSIRVLTGWYWLYCILLAVAYKASMTAILANPAPKVTIDTLDQLVDSEIRCGGWGSQVKLFFETSLDETGQQIGSVFEMVNDAASAVDRVAEGQFAYYENVYFLKDAIAKRQERLREEQSTQRQSHSNDTTDTEATVTPDKSDHNLHIMDDCVINMPISIGLEKNSPLKPLSDKYIRKIIEAGLVQKWLDDVMLPILTAQVSGEDRPNAVMNLRKLYGGFIALSIGSFFGFIILLGEIIHWYFIVQRDPKFDKYALSDYYNKKK